MPPHLLAGDAGGGFTGRHADMHGTGNLGNSKFGANFCYRVKNDAITNNYILVARCVPAFLGGMRRLGGVFVSEMKQPV